MSKLVLASPLENILTTISDVSASRWPLRTLTVLYGIVYRRESYPPIGVSFVIVRGQFVCVLHGCIVHQNWEGLT